MYPKKHMNSVEARMFQMNEKWVGLHFHHSFFGTRFLYHDWV